MRLIDADALHNSLRNKQKWVVRSFYGEKINEGYTYDQVHFAIDDAPTVEPIKVGDVCKECWREGGNVIKVVRCKDCEHWKRITDRHGVCIHANGVMSEIDFCSYGLRSRNR